ncbi:glycosyltransferase [Salinisphaera aquimarina]|uniref:Glycosyltransferase n=1 Tax=Salinisphaera aquimarina TaxID=2094031 RepID=A0ABV7ESI1_9GAMM
MESGEVEARVIAPVPWFFSTHKRFGRYAEMARVPAREIRYGITIDHPRFLVIPKVGMMLSPHSMARAATPALVQLREEGFDFDLIDAHYAYPDGVAASALGRRFDRPVVMTARGSDITLIAAMKGPQRQIHRALEHGEAMITVSRSLVSKITSLGLNPSRLVPLRNGVDLTRFKPLDRTAIRKDLGVKSFLWLTVGHLVELKGVHIAVEALASVDNAELMVVGDGPEGGALSRLATEMGVADRVHFVGPKSHEELTRYYNAADALILASSREGMPNVMLEALACGTAVIGNAVDGIPEVIIGRPAGRLMKTRDAASVTAAWRSLGSDELGAEGRAERRAYAEQFSWQATTNGQIALFNDMLSSAALDQTN